LGGGGHYGHFLPDCLSGNAGFYQTIKKLSFPETSIEPIANLGISQYHLTKVVRVLWNIVPAVRLIFTRHDLQSRMFLVRMNQASP
jgi:hypothetical protein